MPKELTPENYTVESAELYVPDLNDIAKGKTQIITNH